MYLGINEIDTFNKHVGYCYKENVANTFWNFTFQMLIVK